MLTDTEKRHLAACAAGKLLMDRGAKRCHSDTAADEDHFALRWLGVEFPIWSGHVDAIAWFHYRHGKAFLPRARSMLKRWPGFCEKEQGDSHPAIKQIMRQTHASERAIKHWLPGQ